MNTNLFRSYCSASVKRVSSSQGMSLVEVMVAIGIMAIMTGVFAQFMNNQSKQTRVLSEKLALLDLEKLVIGALSSPGSCEYIMTEPTVVPMNLTALSPTNPVRIVVNRPIPANIRPDGSPGPTAVAVGSTVMSEAGRGVVEGIDLVITEGSAGSYKGYWEIRVNQNTLTGRFKPIRVDAILTADVTNLAAATMESCMGQEEATPAPPTTRRAYAQGYAFRWPYATAMCNSDEYMLSGGGYCYSPIGFMVIAMSQPTADMNGWSVACDSYAFTNAYVDVWAICARK